MGRTKPAILACVILFLFLQIPSNAVSKQIESQALSKANGLTIPFAENKGQLEDSNTLFYSSTFAGRVSVYRDGSIGYRLVRNNAGRARQLIEIREKLCGALKTVPSGKDKAIATVSHFQGRDPDKWVVDISTFNTVSMGEIYRGVSLQLQARANNVEKIFFVHPGADPKKIRLNIEGAKALRMTEKGELEVKTKSSFIRFTKPVAYQQINGKKTYIDIAYTVKGRSYGFKVAAFDRSKELIIDPLITGTFQGTADTVSRPTCMAADSQGNIFVAGYSGDQNAVFKFDRRLEQLQSTAFFGSVSKSKYERIHYILHDIAIDRHDAVYLVGATKEEDFPVTQGAFDTRLTKGPYSFDRINPDGFVIKYNADLNKILASTFVGEIATDVAYGIAIDRDDTVVVVGKTNGIAVHDPPFPTTPDAYDTTSGIPRTSKAFVARLDADLATLLAATQLGYNGDENLKKYPGNIAYDVAIDADGAIVVTGITESEHFPVTANCADASFMGESEAFISKFDPDLKHLRASTFLGGASNDKVNVLAIAANNDIVVAGWTLSSDFPVVQGNYDTSFNSDEDGFITRLNSELTTITASTFLGGNEIEQVSDLVIGDDGQVYLCGGTQSSDFPVTDNAYDNSYNSLASVYKSGFYENGDGFFAVLDQAFENLIDSTYLGGTSTDHATSILLNRYATEKGLIEDIIVAGETWSTNFPYVEVKMGRSDVFLCRFNPDEKPEDPPVKGGSGHWSSEDAYYGVLASTYLDINICDDGSFHGIFRMFLCLQNTVGGVISHNCTLPGNEKPNPVSGMIDFKNGDGTITLGDGMRDLPFAIKDQKPDEFTIEVDRNETADASGFRSILHYRDEPQEGTCSVPPPPEGGGSGGCFLNSMGYIRPFDH